MKLYTKEQMIQAYELGLGLTHEEVLEEFVPIQLPTWEEINEIAEEMSVGCTTSFIQGVEWLIDEIKGGQGE